MYNKLRKAPGKKRPSQTSSRSSNFKWSNILPGDLKFSTRSFLKIGSERESQQVQPAESNVESQQVQPAESNVENTEFAAAENNAYKIVEEVEAKLKNNLENGEYEKLKKNFNFLKDKFSLEKIAEFYDKIKIFPELKEAEKHRDDLSKSYSRLIENFARIIQAVEAQPQELGTDKEGSIAVNKRRQVELAMGQGVAANLGQLILHSEDFSSCTPIVMFNKTTKIGGLFHFPAGQLDEKKPSLKAMYNNIQPTEIHLNERALPKTGFIVEESDSYNLYKKDVKNLKGFFEECGFAANDFRSIDLQSPEYAITLGEDGENVLIDNEIDSEVKLKALSVMHDRTEEDRQRIEKEWQDSPSATKYGIDDWNI